MHPPDRFKSVQDWHNFLGSNQVTPLDLNSLRQRCYKQIEALRGRPLLIYATRFIDGLPVPIPNSITLDDVEGFTDLVNSVPANQTSIDVLIHSPGGRPDATERIVDILRNRFSEVHFLIPHSAYSAATMMALSGDTVTLHPSATLGPIDPQLNGTPARSIIRGFEKVKESIKAEGPEALPAYIPLIEKYSLDLLEQCSDAEELSQELVRTWLNVWMFKSAGNEDQIDHAVTYFSNYDEHKLHARPLLFEKIKSFGLHIERAELELSELLWESYILLNGFFSVSAFCKLYENTFGISWGRQFSVTPSPAPPQNPAQ